MNAQIVSQINMLLKLEHRNVSFALIIVLIVLKIWTRTLILITLVKISHNMIALVREEAMLSINILIINSEEFKFAISMKNVIFK